MKMLKLISQLFFFLSVSATAVSQTVSTVDNITNQYQSCLDKGEYMLGCSKRFYSQMESMLNVVYFKLRSSMDATQKTKLKREQKAWLIKRDAYLKKTLKAFEVKNPNNSFDWPQDDAMFMYDDNAEFVKTRVLILLKRFKK